MIRNIQGLRAFAAINVVLFHIIGTASGYGFKPHILSFFEGWGANGVDIFFVVSGFVMYYTQTLSRKSVAGFYVSRLIRIIPLYWLLTSLLILIGILLPSAFNRLTLDPYSIFSSYLFLSQALSGGHPLLYLGWTLEYEILFYLFFGLSIILHKDWQRLLSIFAMLTVAIAIGSSLIVYEFFWGMLLAYIFINKPRASESQGLLILLTGALLLSASIADELQSLELNRIYVWGIPSIFIVAGSVYARQISSRTVLSLGDASYSIYLVQAFTIPFFYKVAKLGDLNMSGDLLALFCLMLSVIAGCVIHSYVEKPLTNILRGSSKNPTQAQS